MELKQKLNTIDAKMWMLNFTLNKTDSVLTVSDEEVVARQKGNLTKINLAICDLKQEIEEEKFMQGESEENVATWGKSIEENIALADEKVKKLTEHTVGAKSMSPVQFL